MIINIDDPLVKLKITSATCSSFAFGTTIYRLCIRRHKLKSDDFWALFAFVALMVQVVAVFLHLPVPNNLSQTARVAAYYLVSATFFATVWASRLSILFSIARVHPQIDRRKHWLWVAASFVVAFSLLLGQIFVVCEFQDPSWKRTTNPQCPVPNEVALCQAITDVIVDSILIIAPIRLFRDLSDRSLRRKLTLIFSTCVVTTIVSLVHAVYILNHAGVKVLISAVVEDTLSLIVANIPVVVTAIIDIHEDPPPPELTLPNLSKIV